MYVAIDGVLKLSYEIEYSTSPDFEAMAELLAETDTVTAIQSYDPNLCEAFLRSSRGEDAPMCGSSSPADMSRTACRRSRIPAFWHWESRPTLHVPSAPQAGIIRARQIGYRALCVLSVAGAAVGVILGFRSSEVPAAVSVLLPSVFRLAGDLITALAVRIGLRSERE